MRADFDILNLGLVIYKSQGLFHHAQEVQGHLAPFRRGLREA